MALKLSGMIKSSGASRLILGRAVNRLSGAAFHTSHTRWNEYIINIQDEDDFKKRVEQNKTPVVLDFHASWCGPCKHLGPRLESLVAKEEGKVILAKVDIDELGDIAESYGVTAVPTVMGIRNNKVQDKFIGLADDDKITSFIKKLAG